MFIRKQFLRTVCIDRIFFISLRILETVIFIESAKIDTHEYHETAVSSKPMTFRIKFCYFPIQFVSMLFSYSICVNLCYFSIQYVYTGHGVDSELNWWLNNKFEATMYAFD